MNDKNKYKDGKNLQKRTKQFAIRIIKLARFLEKDPITRMIGRQIFRSGTSIAANYRASCRSRSVKEFIAKLGIVIEEADETEFWLELLIESRLVEPNLIQDLLKEADEITAIMVSSKNSTIANQKKE
ncbi:MAG: four helix bundle protein [Patescibacteria group bacterium]|mgnify:CR=1 FL=1